MLDTLGLGVLIQVDGPAGSAEFVEYNPDGLGFSQGLAGEPLSAQDLLGAVVVQRDFYGSY